MILPNHIKPPLRFGRNAMRQFLIVAFAFSIAVVGCNQNVEPIVDSPGSRIDGDVERGMRLDAIEHDQRYFNLEEYQYEEE